MFKWTSSCILLLATAGLIAQESDAILFPHDFHVEDVELTCEECHAGLSQSVSLKTRPLPTKEICANCHDGDTASDDCALCHIAPDDPQPFPQRPFRQGPEFSHQFHLDRSFECIQCHTSILEDDGTLPTVKWNLGDCRNCHLKSRPESHGLEWVQFHGMEADAASTDNCFVCHQESTCEQCHELQPFVTRTHPVEFMLSHRFDFLMGDMECSTCHNPETDCASCHRQNSVMPLEHNFPNWVGLSLENGGMHSDRALDEPEYCQVCHTLTTDLTCQRCHS